jgi:pyridoxine 5-phosphate synthase
MTPTALSVNINKIATLRNARGGNIPDLLKVAADIESFGADGITIHPRPDERHIKYRDAHELKKVVKTELNIEGNPVPAFIDLVLEIAPTQVTLVPDAPDAITSNAGWDTLKHRAFLIGVISRFRERGIRTSIFVDADEKMVEGAAETGTDRIELYTERYASEFARGITDAAKPYTLAAAKAHELGFGINAGHDLNLDNISRFKAEVPYLQEVSIGHALICEAMYLGLENVVNMYLHRLR